MNQDLIDYIKHARSRHIDDVAIKNSAIVAGWDEKLIDAALKSNLDLIAPPPPSAPSIPNSGHNAAPIAVVQNMTTRGVEYIIMFIAMGASAIAFGILLHSLVDRILPNAVTANGYYVSSPDTSAVSIGSAALVVALPIFALLFLRLKRAELKDATLRRDPSRRRAIQLTLIVTFLVGLSVVIGYIFNLLNSLTNTNALANLLHSAITLLISGGIFTYYWIDTHSKKK